MVFTLNITPGGEGQHKFRSHYKEKKQSQQTRCESGRAVNKVPVSSATVVTIRNQDGKTLLCALPVPHASLCNSGHRQFYTIFPCAREIVGCRRTVTSVLAPQMLHRAFAQVNVIHYLDPNYPCTKRYVLNPGLFLRKERPRYPSDL